MNTVRYIFISGLYSLKSTSRVLTHVFIAPLYFFQAFPRHLRRPQVFKQRGAWDGEKLRERRLFIVAFFLFSWWCSWSEANVRRQPSIQRLQLNPVLSPRGHNLIKIPIRRELITSDERMRTSSLRKRPSRHVQDVWVLSEMASGRGSTNQEIKQHFATKEGCYRLLDLSVYSRPTKIPYSVQQCHPVRVSFVTVKDQGGCNDRIAFNVGRELYFYIYKGVRKVSLNSLAFRGSLRK